MKKSNISGFYKLSPEKRRELVKDFAGLSDDEIEAISKTGALSEEQADHMIENMIGVMPLPLGIATNFRINGKDYLIPMAVEEPSVVAAASNSARIARIKGGFRTSATEPIMIGQIQLIDVPDIEKAKSEITKKKKEILELCNQQDPVLVRFGGGAKDMEMNVRDSPEGKMLVFHILVDCRDVMGANAVNTMAETISPLLEELSGGKVLLKIISNLARYRLARAKAVFDKDAVGGEKIVDMILKAYAFAVADRYRCATHNKGIMNGIDAVVIATGNDWRAIEAGAHSYAAINDSYASLTRYYKNEDGDLVGEIELPMAVGLVGGMTSIHPTAKANMKIIGAKTAAELSQVIASVGLAQNFAALRALSDEGIQKGHMKLHARNLAAMAGAKGKEVDKVVAIALKEADEQNVKIRFDRIKEIYGELKESD